MLQIHDEHLGVNSFRLQTESMCSLPYIKHS